MPSFETTDIDGVVIAVHDVHRDERGAFSETYRRSWFALGREMVQSNLAERSAGSVVGLHFHLHQADYWQVASGTARVVLHDLRRGSRTEGASSIFEVSASDRRGVYIPPGVGHGFAAVTDVALTYLVDAYYNPADELGVAWHDPELALDWGIDDPVVSARDKGLPLLAELPADQRPHARLRT